MIPYVQDIDLTIYCSDALTCLRSLPDESVDACVTSPPYLGLRDYGTGTWDGGDPDCEHSVGGQVKATRGSADPNPTGQRPGVDASRCRRCGAHRVDKQLGLESTVGEYVQALVDVFREVRRVLVPTGSVYLNLGDSFAGGGNGARDAERWPKQSRNAHGFRSMHSKKGHGKPKDLLMVPARVAIALCDEGWWLRSEILWCKPNGMVESVADRPTKSSERIYLLTKGRNYYFGQDDLRQPNQPDGRHKTLRVANGNAHPDYASAYGRERWPNEAGANIRDWWVIPVEASSDGHFAVMPQELARRCILGGCPPGGTVLDPFLGSGTTALVARRLGRRCIGIELSEPYARLAAERTRQLSLLAEPA